MKINEEFSNEILEINEKIKDEISLKIKEYKDAFLYNEKDFFAEIAFCILTPQSKAKNAWKIIEILKENGLLYSGTSEELVDYLNLVRFKNTKAKRLVDLRNLLTIDKRLAAKEIIFHTKNVIEIREWLVKNVKGFGYKEASHVLRNLGFGENIAILDRHILRTLKKLDIIDEIPKTLSPSNYKKIENKMREYSKYVGISMDRLDLIFWYKQLNYLFK
ncbi:N-glycosylase/DNA lyase [Sneathia sanguinegens]|uniref:8-oxoguanine DNA glycosylase/AP lyase n=1 Tax=Sneathia sanguinegens TaxID=40543 RepID=A0ABT7HJH6_9FUSO|nr:N-glycosylase/DNA lyase [Sneathia sanguinegens]MDK9580685.1 N-glycosylase/DNA lyase [Sneathia sanguinegens]